MIHPNRSPGATADPLETPGPVASSGPPLLSAAPDDAARFGQFAGWITLAAFAFGILELLGAAVLRQPGLGVAGGLSLGYGLCVLAARVLLRRGQLRAAVLLTAVGLLMLVLV